MYFHMISYIIIETIISSHTILFLVILSTSVDVYVLDTGVDTNHQEFSPTGNGRIVSNIWNAFGAVSSDTDSHGHGTHCAGTVGGRSIGVARCANMYVILYYVLHFMLLLSNRRILFQI